MINSLQILRALFTLVIFLGHYPFCATPYLQTPSDCALSFFFMLSGFVLSLTHERKVLGGRDRFLPFMLSRVRKFYPLHLLCFAVALALSLYFVSPLDATILLSNLFLVQSWFPAVSVHFGLNAVSWFLSDLLAAYLLFFPVLKAFARFPRLAWGALGVAIVLYFCVVPVMHPVNPNWAFCIFPPLRTLDFVIGMALYQIYKMVSAKGARRTPVGEMAVCAFILASLAAAPVLPLWLTLASWWWLPAGMLILYFALPAASRRIDRAPGGEPTGIPSYIRKSLIWFGDISFEFYMLHALIIQITVHAFRHLAATPVWLPLLMAFSASVIAALLVRMVLNRLMRCK